MSDVCSSRHAMPLFAPSPSKLMHCSLLMPHTENSATCSRHLDLELQTKSALLVSAPTHKALTMKIKQQQKPVYLAFAFAEVGEDNTEPLLLDLIMRFAYLRLTRMVSNVAYRHGDNMHGMVFDCLGPAPGCMWVVMMVGQWELDTLAHAMSTLDSHARAPMRAHSSALTLSGTCTLTQRLRTAMKQNTQPTKHTPRIPRRSLSGVSTSSHLGGGWGSRGVRWGLSSEWSVRGK